MNEKWLKEDGRKEWVRKMKQGYHEIKEHGKREFPFNIYPCSIPVDFTHVALHWHEEMEIIAVKKGNGRITVDTVSYPVSEGDILAVFPGQLHAISCGSGERMESVTVGYVSALNREIETSDGNTRVLLQTDAAINPGNSGGALLNMKGEVIGINAAKYSSTEVEGIGYAIPVSGVQDILDELMNRKTRSEVAEEKRGYLGIQGTTVDEDAAAAFGMPKGVYVYKILKDGAAADSQLREKDIITKLDGMTVKSMQELQKLLKGYEAGETIELLVQRQEDGQYKEIQIPVTLTGLPGSVVSGKQ